MVVKVRIAPEKVESWFYIFGFDIASIAHLLKQHLDSNIQVAKAHQIIKSLKESLSFGMHPFDYRGYWLCISGLTAEKLRLLRVKRLVEMARNGEELSVCPGLSSDINFEDRLASYMYADTSLFCSLCPYELNFSLEESGAVTEAEAVQVGHEAYRLFSDAREMWKFAGYSDESPEQCARRDKETDKFTIARKTNLWAISRRINSTNP